MSLIKIIMMTGVAASLGVAVATPASAGSIVVRSTGTKAYPTGKVLADNVRIALRAGETVTLLDGKGTRVLTGPGTFSTVVGGGAAQETRVKNILGNSGTRVARTGAIRSGATAARPTSIWQADISRSGTVCVANPAAFSAWRPATETPASYTITHVESGKSATVAFPSARAQAPWPAASLPVTDGGTYRISGPGLVGGAEVKMAVMGVQLTGLEGTVSELMKRGCTSQYELLIDLVNVVDTAPSAG